MSTNFEWQQSIVKESLFAFLQRNCIDDVSTLSAIDDIVLSYVASVLEDLGVEGVDSFEVDEFVEMMGAYFPGFMNADISAVCDWLFSLATKLSQMKKPRASSGTSESESSTSSTDDYQQNDRTFIHLYLSKDGSSSHSSASPPPKSLDGESEHEIVSDRAESIDDDDQMSENIQLLQEMFPNVCVLEMTRCLAVADGCPERAAQLIIDRLDSHESLDLTTSLQSVGRKFRNNTLDDKQLKESILSRYAFVDKAEDEREHKPINPKTEPKKLIRYRDSQVVSIKGEKFSEIKRDDDDETVRKATTISLKPARQYRFH